MARSPQWLVALAMAVAASGCAAPSAATRSGAPAAPPSGGAGSPKVVVYYMHRTFRCISCLWIEHQTRKTLEEAFPSDLASGRLELRVADYWIQKDLAARYGVDTVSVVVVSLSEGQEVSHQTLDRVWELKGKSDEFRAYVADAVRAALAAADPRQPPAEGPPKAGARP